MAGQNSSDKGYAMLQFKIRKKFIFALGLTSLLLVTLLIVCIIQQEATGKTLILGVIMLPVLAFFIESWRRQLSLTDDAVIACRLFRTKRLPFSEITSVDTVKVRRRVFVSINTEADFLIFSNNYDHFDQLISQLQERLPQNVISAETRTLIDESPHKSNDLFSVWLAIVVLILIIYIQLGGTF